MEGKVPIRRCWRSGGLPRGPVITFPVTRMPPPATPLSGLTRLKPTSTRKSLHHKLAESRRVSGGGDGGEGGGGVWGMFALTTYTIKRSRKKQMSADYSSTAGRKHVVLRVRLSTGQSYGNNTPKKQTITPNKLQLQAS